MGDIGYLLGIPTQSVAIRLVVAALVAVPLARVLLKIGIRQPRLRVLVSLAPAIVLTLVLALSWGDTRMPRLMQSFEGRGLALRVGDSYVNFAPFAAGLLVAVWAIIAGTRITLRIIRLRRAHAQVVEQMSRAGLLPLRVALTVERIAASLRLPMPPVAVVDDCAGGASVHGIRRPRLLLDARLVERLDAQELEGVIAHELAHVKRHDNLTAVLLSFVRDVFFFVPGADWAHRQLCAERELAADQVACGATNRPGALASGLIKVIDLQGPVVGCAALMPEMPSSTLTGRIRLLVEPQELTRVRRGMEVTTVVMAIAVAAGAGIGGPALVASGDGVDEVHLAWTPSGSSSHLDRNRPVLDDEATAFDVYRSMPLPRAEPVASAVLVDDEPDDFRRSTLEACRVGAVRACSTERQPSGLGLRARTTVRLSPELIEEWKATPVISTEVFNVWFLRRDGDTRTR